jgi:hypothetical protein
LPSKLEQGDVDRPMVIVAVFDEPELHMARGADPNGDDVMLRVLKDIIRRGWRFKC